MLGYLPIINLSQLFKRPHQRIRSTPHAKVATLKVEGVEVLDNPSQQVDIHFKAAGLGGHHRGPAFCPRRKASITALS